MAAALEAAAPLEAVFVDAGAVGDPELSSLAGAASAAGAEVHQLRDGVLDRASDARAPQGICAICRPPLVALDEAMGRGTVLVLCDLADPGNLGSAVRSAHAAGAAGVVVCGEGVDVCNPKALRATAGAVFFEPVAATRGLDEVVARAREQGRLLVGSAPRGGSAPWALPLADAVLLVGGEARGLAPEALAACDELATIPMRGRAESLNAGVAAAVLCVEAQRQRDSEAPLEASPTI